MEMIKKESDEMEETEDKEEEEFELNSLPSLPLPPWKGSPTESKLLLESLTKMDGSVRTMDNIE